MAVTYRSFVNKVAFFLALLLNPRTASGFHSLKNEFRVNPLLSLPSQINLPLQYIQINVDAILFTDRQFDSFFDTTHTVIGVTHENA